MKNQILSCRLFFSLFVFLNCFSLSSQKIDSFKYQISLESNDSIKVELLNYIARDYRDYYPDSISYALVYAKQAYSLAKSDENPKGQYDALNYMGSFYRDLSERESCIAAYERGMAIADSIGNQRKMLQLKGNLATAYIMWDDLERAIQMKYENIEAFEQMNDSTALMVEWYGIGHVHFNNQNPKEAIPLYYKALNFRSHPVIMANLGQAYSMVDQYDSAFHYLNLAIDRVPKGSYNETDFLEILGTICIEEKKYDYGILMLERALKNFGTDTDLSNAIEVKVSLTNAYLAKNQIDKAYSIFHAISTSGIDKLSFVNKSKYWRTAYQLNERTEKYKSALNAYKNFVSFRDSLDNNELRSDLKEIEVKYETAKKEEAIKSLETQNRIDAINIKNKNRILWMSLGVLLTLLGLLYFIYKLYKQGKEKNRIISSALSDKELLLKEIHHRVKNNLQVVSSLLSLQSEYIKDESALSAINEGRNRVRSMSLIHQNLYTGENLKGINMKSYLENLITGLFDSYNINDEWIQLRLSIQDIDLDVDTVVPLGLITNELVSNALKHGFQNNSRGTVSVSLHEVEDQLELIVKDDGDGLDVSQINDDISSFGYQMIYAFTEKLSAKLSLISEDGTNIKLTVKDYQKT